MNKRDVIIIAVLLNTGLLSILAMMAMNQDEGMEESFKVSNPLALEQSIPENVQKINKESYVVKNVTKNLNVASDEWDIVLKDYVRESSSHLALDEEILEDFEKEPVELNKPVLQKVATPKATAEKKVTEPLKKPDQSKVVASEKPVIQAGEKKVGGPTVEVFVKKGDALEKIARSYGTTVEYIRALNNLKNDRLSVGQKLLVPVDGVLDGEALPKTVNQLVSKTVNQAVNEAVQTIEYYVIKSGDNPWKIAKQYGVKFDDLLKLNQLDEEKARNLKIGDRIRVK